MISQADLHRALEQVMNSDLEYNRSVTDFARCSDEEAFYRLMKRNYRAALGALIENRKKKNSKNLMLSESLAQAWSRLAMSILPEMEYFIHLQILQLECETVINGGGSDNGTMQDVKDPEKVLMDGIDRVVEKHEQGGNLCHDVDVEFLEMLRAILKLLDAVRRMPYFPVEKLKYCVAMYLTIYDRAPTYNMYQLFVDKVMIVDFLKQLREAYLEFKRNHNSSNDVPNEETQCEDIFQMKIDEPVRFERKFKTLASTFSNMKDLYSLTKIMRNINLIDKIDVRIEFPTKMVFGILRAIQVIGETFKSTSETPSISTELQSLLLEKIHNQVFASITGMRNFLSHDFTDQKYSIYKRASEGKFHGGEYYRFAGALLELREPLEEAIERTIRKNLIAFLGRISQSKSIEAIQSKCEVTDLRPVSQGCLNFRVSKPAGRKDELKDAQEVALEETIEETFMPCVESLRIIDDLKEAKRISKLHLGLIVAKHRYVYHVKNKSKILTTFPVDDGDPLNKLFPGDVKEEAFTADIVGVMQYFEETLDHKDGRYCKVFISDYFRLELEQQLLDNISLSREQFSVFETQLWSYFKNVLNIDEKYGKLKAFCKSIKHPYQDSDRDKMRQMDIENFSTVFNQLLEDMANILSIGPEMTEVELVSLITSNQFCDTDLAAVEMLLLDALEILVSQKVLPQYSSFIGTARPIISGRFMRNYLAHDGLIYDAICGYSRNPRATIVLNAICLIRYLKVYLFPDPKNTKTTKANVTEQEVTFEAIMGILPEQDKNLSEIKLEEINTLTDSLVKLPSSKVKAFCVGKTVDKKKWQKLILHAITLKNEPVARKLIDQLRTSNTQLPIASFLVPAVTKRMPALVEHICKLDPKNVDYVNPDKRAQRTALYRAVEVGCCESVQILHRFKASVDSPLLRALELRRDDIFDMLLPTSWNIVTSFTLVLKIIDLAAITNRPDLLKKFRSFVFGKLVPCWLIFAIKYGSVESAATILDIDPSLVNSTEFRNACYFGSERIIKLFLSRGADYNWIEQNLFYALFRGNQSLLKLFLKSGKINEESSKGLFKKCLQADQLKLAWDVVEAGHPFQTISTLREWNGLKIRLPEMCRLKPEIVDCLDGYTLGLAILDGMNAFVEEMLPKLLPKLTVRDHGRLLNCAVKRRNLTMIRYLLEHGCDVNAADASGLTPLGMALSLGWVFRCEKGPKKVQVVQNKKVDEAGVGKKQKQRKGKKKGQNKNSEDVKSEDAKSEDVKSEDAKNENAKSKDAKSEDVKRIPSNDDEKRKEISKITEIVRILVKHGADVNKETNKYCYKNDLWIGRDRSLECAMRDMELPLALALLEQYNELVDFLLSKGARVNDHKDDEKSLLIKYMEIGFIEMTDKLIDLGESIDYARDYRYPKNNGTMSRVSVPENGSLLHLSVQHHKFEMYQYLVERHNFDETLKDAEGNTVLHIAVIYQNMDIMKYFLGKDEAWKIVNNDGRTPIQLALCHLDDFLQSMHLFHVLNTRPEFEEDIKSLPYGSTLLHNAAMSSKVPTDVMNRLIKDSPTHINRVDDFGATPLHHALSQGNIRIVKILLRKKATLFPPEVDKDLIFSHLASVLASRTDIVSLLLDDQETTDALKSLTTEGKNLLHLAILQNNYALCDHLLKPTVFTVDILNTVDSEGNTALHLAASIDSPRLASLFLSKNLSIKAVNGDGLTPLQVARNRNKTKAEKYLQLKGAACTDMAGPPPDDVPGDEPEEQRQLPATTTTVVDFDLD